MAEDRVLGRLPYTMGNLDQAPTFCRKGGYTPERGWTGWGYPDSLLARDGEGNRAKAMTLLDEPLAISSELGKQPLMERMLSRWGLLGHSEGKEGS